MSLVAFFEIFISSIERFFTYFSIKFDNLYLKWNFLRISLWKWKKWILFYERLLLNIILVENTKLFFFFCWCVYYITYQIKKYVCVCVYIYIYIYVYKIKKTCVCVCVCVYIYMYVGVVLINILVLQFSPQTKISGSAPTTTLHTWIS